VRGELRAPAASSADVSIPVEILPEAQRLIDEADERRSTEHGFDAVNPLLDDILHAAELLRENPELGLSILAADSATRFGACFCAPAGTSTTASTRAAASSKSSSYGLRIAVADHRFDVCFRGNASSDEGP
jgi:hypothetical protein